MIKYLYNYNYYIKFIHSFISFSLFDLNRGNILEDKSFVQRHKESLLRNSFDQYDDEYV